MRQTVRSVSPMRLGILAAVAISSCGCTTALTTAHLGEGLWNPREHAAEDPPASAMATDDGAEDRPEPSAGTDTAADDERRRAAVDEAVARLARVRDLDPAARETLVETLQRTHQEDWPVVVEAFASSLAAARTAGDGPEEMPGPAAGAAAPHVVAKATLDDAGESAPAAAEPAVPPAPEPGHEAASPAAAAAPDHPGPATDPEAAPAAAALAIRNACFASRVEAWGVLERFPDARFRPGQELIVYFELENLATGRTAAGHTTCIDTTLALVAGDGEPVHEWTFEPIAETSARQRRDYFARYIVRIPDHARSGECRLDLTVVDTLAGTTGRVSLPLEIVTGGR